MPNAVPRENHSWGRRARRASPESRCWHRAYTIIPDGEHLVLNQREGDGGWEKQYRFSLEPHNYPDYAGMCHYHQTSPQSHFTKARICSRTTPDGRITLSDMRFITTVGVERNERLLTSEEEYGTTLVEHFGIDRKSVV